jgi:arylsulfatase A-like enzyme
MNMGHHGICGKGNGTLPVNLYDTSVKVPGIVSRPGYAPEGVVNHGLYSHYDIMPTLMDYLGIENTEAGRLPGRSFAGLLRGEGDEGNGEVVVYDEYGPVRMVRTEEWKYVHRYVDEAHELYDLVNDPGERTNVFGAAEHQDRIEEMRARLQGWFDRYAVPELDASKLPVTGCGQRNLATKPDAFAQSWPASWLRK